MSDEFSLGTELILDVFKANGLLLVAGDNLSAGEGLTSARWQVLGAIALAGEPLPVPRIARRMGLTRQSVQVSVNRLAHDEMLTAERNIDHARSPLFALTDLGLAAYQRLTVVQRKWISDLTAELPHSELQIATRVLRSLTARLAANAKPAVHTPDPTATIRTATR